MNKKYSLAGNSGKNQQQQQEKGMDSDGEDEN